jgi:putative membrane-bound dehydrogenase-like protein
MDSRSRLFFGTCLALIPTGASFSLVSNILGQLKQEFILTNYQVGFIGGAALWGMALSLLIMGPLVEVIGLKNGARLAFIGHLAGISTMIFAATRIGDRSAFWLLMAGAVTLAAGNGMIEVAGNPLVAALYPNEKTKRLNWFHAFFPIGLILGGLVGFALAEYGGGFARWPYQLAVIYLPIIVYGVMVLPQQFPKTENAAAGVPMGEMFRSTLSSPLFLLMVSMMAITTSLELGPMRWIPSVLQSGGMHGILVLVWISGWMAVLRGLSGHAIERLSPTGMLLMASILTGGGLFLLSFADGLVTALGAATIFAWGVAFFFPTMVGTVSERVPNTGSLGIVLTAGIGLGMAGAVGVPVMGKLADRFLAESLPAATADVLRSVDSRFPDYLAEVQNAADPATVPFRARDVQEAIDQTQVALAREAETGSINNDATANALRAIVGAQIPDEPLIEQANNILQPAELAGGKESFRYVAPIALLLILVFGMMYLKDKAAGGYRAAKSRAAALLFVLLSVVAAPAVAQQVPLTKTDRIRVLFLGDNGHHRPADRAKQLLPVLAARGIDLYYVADPAMLNANELKRYHAVMLYNNHMVVSPEQFAALNDFVMAGNGLVVLHCASASFQNSEPFIKMVGAAFKSHGTGTFSAVRVSDAHPAIKGVAAFESWDETYVHAKHNPVDRTVLEVRRDNGHDEPWTWVRTHGKGRVFYTAWGHDQRTWGQPGFQQLVDRGTRWSIGDRGLTHEVPMPKVDSMELAVPLPVYKQFLPNGERAPWNTPDSALKVAQKALSTPLSVQLMTLPPKFNVKPFANEPLIGNIIDFTWDARGRMWAVETQDYPNNLLPDSVPGNDRILILDDKNANGRIEPTEVTVFAGGLNLATSLAFADGGLVVAQAPHMLFLKDTNGDDKADEKRTIMTGFPRNDTHGSISNLRYGFDNQVWGSVGYNGFRGTVGGVTYARGAFGSGYFRFVADGSSLDYVARTGNNTWGVAFNEEGHVFGSTANSNPTNFVHIPGRYYRSIGQREPVLRDIADRMDVFPTTEIQQVDQFGRYTAGAAHEIYTARAFPSEYWNSRAFVAEPTAHVIGMFDLKPNGSAFRATNRWSLMASRDAWAAPVQVKVGPDGAIWVADFYTLVAQHNPTPTWLVPKSAKDTVGCCGNGPGNAYETPNRDRLHGRIYRIAYDSAPTAPRLRLDNATPDQLVAALTNDNMFWRHTAQRLLVEKKLNTAAPALIRLVNTHTVDALGLNPGALHAVWTLDGLGLVRTAGPAQDAVRKALQHPAAAVRRAALQVLPRDAALLDGMLAAGIIPDRESPTSVSYTVNTGLLQDADAHVRVQALLTLSEVTPSAKTSTAVAEMMFAPENARDPWLPDAVAIAGAKQGVDFLRDAMLRRVPANDSVFVMGIRRAVTTMARSHAAKADASAMVTLIETVPRANERIALGLLDAIATSWPEETPPTFTDAQRATLRAAAAGASAPLTEAYGKVAARWGITDIFSGAR